MAPLLEKSLDRVGDGDRAVLEVELVVLANVLEDVAVVDHEAVRLREALGARVGEPVEPPEPRAVANVEVGDGIERQFAVLFLVEVLGAKSLLCTLIVYSFFYFCTRTMTIGRRTPASCRSWGHCADVARALCKSDDDDDDANLVGSACCRVCASEGVRNPSLFCASCVLTHLPKPGSGERVTNVLRLGCCAFSVLTTSLMR